MSIIEYIGSIGGVAGILAVLMFFAYRHLVNQMRDDRKFMEDRLTQVISDYNDAQKAGQEVQLKNTQVLTELITWLKAKNGH